MKCDPTVIFGEGAADLGQHPVRVVDEITPGEAQHPIPGVDQAILLSTVVLEGLRCRVRQLPVDLDHQPMPGEDDVEDPDASGVVVDRDAGPPLHQVPAPEYLMQQVLGPAHRAVTGDMQQPDELRGAVAAGLGQGPARQVVAGDHLPSAEPGVQLERLGPVEQGEAVVGGAPAGGQHQLAQQVDVLVG